MDARLNELMAALPEEQSSEAGFSREQLQEIFAEMSLRPVPTGSVHRFCSVSELSAQVALAYAALWIRGWFADAGAKERRAMETNLRLGVKIFRRLGYLRGALMKVGQTAGNMPHIFPAQIADTLDRLHFEAPPMHYSLIREVLSNELGGDPEEIFQSFEKEAFSAASIGQVHRAKLKSGKLVAVKVQYPGIARTVEADFRTLNGLVQPLRLGKDWESLKTQLSDIHHMIKLEVDYVHEAKSLRRVRVLFEGEADFVVPKVYDEYSTGRVLTMDFIPGLHLPEFLATQPPQDLRNRFGTKLFYSWHRMHAARMNYADPQSGNYLFMDDGRLGLIDFGCVQKFNDEEFELLRLGYRIDRGDESAIRELLRLSCNATAADFGNQEYMGLINESIRWQKEPVLHEGPFDFGDEEYLKRGVAWFAGLVAKRYTRSHPMWAYFHRSSFGVKALLLRLRAQVDMRDMPLQQWWNSE